MSKPTCNIILACLLACFLPLSSLLGQCGISGTYNLEDAATTSFQILISDAVNDDLTTDTQCVARVELDFSHAFIGDLDMTLYSPAGQSVQIIGRGVQQSRATSFINWDIAFVPCDSTPMPDIGIPSRWDNLAPWAIFTDYQGSYLPYGGCLEDFNMGSINGVWTLEVDDISNLGDGTLRSFTIIFCDGSEVNCEVCDVAVPAIRTDTSTVCIGSTGLLDLNEQFDTDATVDTSKNIYTNVLYANGQVLAYEDTILLENYGVGTYTICPITINKEEEDQLPLLSSILSPSGMETYLETEKLCAISTTECHTLQIIDKPDTLRNEAFACIGDIISYRGRSYTETTRDTIVVPGPYCDTIDVFFAEIIDPRPTILPNDPIITCIETEIDLAAQIVDPNSGVSYQWSTVDGNILNQNNSIATINAPGTYKVVVADRGCSDSTLVVVQSDDSQPDITLSADSLTCAADMTDITVNSNLTIDTYNWRLPDMTTSSDPSIRTGEAGSYTVTVTADNGCSAVKSIQVDFDTLVVLPTLDTLSIRCDSNHVDLVPIGVEQLNYAYAWSGPGFSTNTWEALNLVSQGTYNLQVTADNGCQKELSTLVTDEREFPALSFTLPTVDCSDMNFEASLTSTLTLASAQWREVGGTAVYDGESVNVTSGGLHSVQVLTPEGCMVDSLIDIPVDTIVPNIQLFGGRLDCVADTVVLQAVGDVTGATFEWVGPGNITYDILTPTVDIAGVYTFNLEADNGCTISDTVSVSKSDEKPTVLFDINHITCINDTGTISVSNKSLDYLWSVNDFGVMEDSLRLGEPGVVMLEVTDPNTGCGDNYVFEILEFTDAPEVTLSTDIIDCNRDSVQLMVETMDTITTFRWDSVAPWFADSLQPYASSAGKYLLTSYNRYGCEAKDSIEVEEDVFIADLRIDSVFFGCGDDRLRLRFRTSTPIDSVAWAGPSGFESSAVRPWVNEDGLYNLRVVGENGCEGFESIDIVTDTVRPVVSILPPDTLKCTDKEVFLTLASSDYRSISWEELGGSALGMDDMQRVTDPGNYVVSVDLDNNCSASDTVEVVSLLEFPDISVSIDQIDCDTDTATLTASTTFPNIEFTWKLASGDVSGGILRTGMGGNYLLEALTPRGCIDSTFHRVIPDFEPPSTAVEVEDTLSCKKPEIFLAGDVLANTYEWSFPGEINRNGDTIYVTHAGVYQVDVLGPNGCTAQADVAVEIDTARLSLDITSDTLTCAKGKVVINLVASDFVEEIMWAGPFSFMSDMQSPNVSFEGVYHVVAAGENGCTSEDSIEVIFDNYAPTFDFKETVLPCSGIGTTLGVTSEDEIEQCRWFGPSNFFSEEDEPLVFEPGQYVASCITSTGCPSVDTFILQFDTIRPVFSALPDSLTCNEPEVGLLALDASDDKAVAWYLDGALVASQEEHRTTTPGLYQLVVTGNNECQDTLEVELFDDQIHPDVAISQLDSFICEQNEIRLLAETSDALLDGMLTWQWEDADGKVFSRDLDPTVYATGQYSFVATTLRNGCITERRLSVDSLPYPRIDLTIGIRDASCLYRIDGKLTVMEEDGGYPPYTYNINGTTYDTTSIFRNLDGGIYSVGVKDLYGCRDSMEVRVLPGADPAIALPADTLITLGDSIFVDIDFLTGAEDIDSVRWASSAVDCDTCFGVWVKPWEATILSVTATDDDGCTGTDEMFIRVKRNADFKMANIFSPKGGEGNRIFYVPYLTGVEQVESFKVYDRFGELVHDAANFPSGDSSYGWDGKVQGRDVQSDVYTYILKLIYVDGRQLDHYGDVFLMR